MFRTFCCCTLGVFLWTTAANAQVTFEQKFPEKSKFTTNHESKSTQTLTLNGMDIDTKSATFILSQTSIGSRAADGTLTTKTKTESLQSDITLPGGLSIQFDSANPNKKAPIPQLEPALDELRAASQVTINVERDAKNKIVSAKLNEGEFEKLSDSAKERFDADSLKTNIENALQALPDNPVKKGDEWERSKEVKIGAGQVMTFRTKYEYAGPSKKDGVDVEKIIGKTLDVNYRVDGNAQLQTTKSDLKVVNSEITILFDPALGAIVSSSSKTQVAGPMTLVISNMEFDGKVDLTIEENFSRQK